MFDRSLLAKLSRRECKVLNLYLTQALDYDDVIAGAAAAKQRFGDFQNFFKRCFWQLKRAAAPGVDRVDFYEYRENLDENIVNLVKRLKQKNYRTLLVRRRYIPKINCKLRPLGIPATDDKVLQFAMAKILEAIYEEDFLAPQRL